MADGDFARRVSGVGALADPVRRSLYRLVAAADAPVTRQDAAATLGLAPHVARFHLDRLVEEGLLAIEYRRVSGRTGPGAGRSAKLYRRADGEVAVSLPERHYDLAGHLMAEAIEAASANGIPVAEALAAAAAERGRRAAGLVEGASSAVDAVCAALGQRGYEPRVLGRADDAGAAGATEVGLANCPFHALAREHTELVCGMNLALLEGLSEGLAETLAGDADPPGPRISVRLAPTPGRCCVVLTVAPGGEDTSTHVNM